MKSLLQLLITTLLPLVAASVIAQPVIDKPDAQQDLQDAWDWAQDELDGSGQAWIVFGFTARLDEKLSTNFTSFHQDYIEWNRAGNGRWNGNWYYNNSVGWHNSQSLAALQAGVSSPQEDYLVPRELLFLAHFEDGILREIRLLQADATVDWRNSPIYWLGNYVADESFRHQLQLFGTIEEPRLQRTLIRSLGLHSVADRDRNLLAILNDDSRQSLQYAVLEALAMQESSLVRDTLAAFASDENAELVARRIAISGLSRYQDAETLELLTRLSDPHNPQAVREEAVESLALNADGLEVVADLIADDDNRAVLRAGLRGLSRYHAYFDVIAETAESHRDSKVRETALALAARMDGEQAFPLLRRIFESDPSSDLREEALQALDEAPAELAVPFLLSIANGADRYESDFREEAVDSLSSFDASLVMDDLNRLAWSDSDEDVRENAVRALAELGNASVNGLLLELARNHPSSHTRREAMDELEDLLL
jgi:HEAT repeat protein